MKIHLRINYVKFNLITMNIFLNDKGKIKKKFYSKKKNS